MSRSQSLSRPLSCDPQQCLPLRKIVAIRQSNAAPFPAKATCPDEPCQPRCPRGNSFFISVGNSSLWRRKGCSSIFNPEYISFIATLVKRLIKDGCPQEKILILSYCEERRILAELFHHSYGYKRIEVKSVDGCQGTENDLVIVSTCRPVVSLGLGFVSDRKRQCVAMSAQKKHS